MIIMLVIACAPALPAAVSRHGGPAGLARVSALTLFTGDTVTAVSKLIP